MSALVALALLLVGTESAPPVGDPDVTGLVHEVAAEFPDMTVSATHGFVVATRYGDARHAKVVALVEAVVRAGQAAFFATPPREPWTVFVMADAKAYRRQAKRLFGAGFEPPVYGAADKGRRIIVLDHAPGEGTLAHELMHPLLTADFPMRPAWLDESLPALFEHKAFAPLRFMRNWRAADLRGQRPTLSELFAADWAVMRERSRVMIALGRHLLVFVSEKGKLEAFYRALRARPEQTAEVLAATLGQTMEAIEADFEKWLGRGR